MFIQPTMDKLHALKLTGMADAVRKQLEDPGASQLSFEERLGLIIDHHWSWKENQALQRRLMNSNCAAMPASKTSIGSTCAAWIVGWYAASPLRTG